MVHTIHSEGGVCVGNCSILAGAGCSDAMEGQERRCTIWGSISADRICGTLVVFYGDYLEKQWCAWV